jgi:hypothetical protein
LDLGGPAPDSAGRRVESKVADLEHAGPLQLAPTRERPETGKQLGEGKRLHEVVVGAGVEARDTIVYGVACGEHEHGDPDTVVAQAAAGLEATHPRQHHVEDDRIVGQRVHHPERVLAVRRDVGGEPFLDQAAANQARHAQLILDDQYAHRLIVPNTS